MAEQCQSHQGQHEELKERECSGLRERGGDDNTGDGKRRGRELHEEDRRVVQKVSPSDASTSGISGIGGTGKTTEAEDVHNQEQSIRENLSKYDVFLNHRGPDTKKTVVSHLYEALRRAGCHPFLDAKSLVKGQHALTSINNGVLVHVAIFSPSYAESKYCLDELCDMLASKKPMIPVFYNVEPEDLRWLENEKGPFAKAFCHHLERGRDQDAVRWKKALHQAACITGFRLADWNNELRLVEEVTAAVLKAFPAPPPLAPACHLVGLEETSKHVVNMLHEMGDHVGVLGICGTGGIGKTTLAEVVYDQQQSIFKSKCFLKDVNAKGLDIMDLQINMVTDLLGEDAEMMVQKDARKLVGEDAKKMVGKDAKKVVGDYPRWFEMIKKQKVLIVVDDITNAKQFYDLIPDLKQLAPGSRVLITSRARDVLNNIMLDAPQHALYFMPELSFSNSLELFAWCAFRKVNLDAVDASFHDNVMKIIEACGGVPLALRVIGGALADKENQPECWSEACSLIGHHADIMSRLRISYDGLVNDEDKAMFMDIASFMFGHPKHVALAVWDSLSDYSSPNLSLSRLIDKGLVEVDGEGLLSMHVLLRDMGRNIAMEMAKLPSHIWDPSMATRIIKMRQGLEKVLALSLIGVNSSQASQAKSLAKMKELRYLVLDGCPMNVYFSGWLQELRWLQWRCFPHEELPSNMKLPNLAVLDLASSPHLTHLWVGDFEEECPCQELRVLILSKCINLEELPKDINKLVKLKFLNLDSCLTLSSLPDSLGDLRELEYLDISQCYKLTSLPNISCLMSLQILKLIGCRSLLELPESFGSLSNLEELWLDGCERLQELPSSIVKLTKLKVLRLRGTAIKGVHFQACKSLILKDVKDAKGTTIMDSQMQRVTNLFGEDSRKMVEDCHNQITDLSNEVDFNSFQNETFDIEDKGDGIADDMANDGDDVMPMGFLNFIKDLDLLEGHEPFNVLDIDVFNVASDALQNDYGLRNLLESILEAVPSIRDIGIEEAFLPTQDQTAIAIGFFNDVAGNLEFYFENGETMAKIVGVGMQYARAILKPGIIFEVQEVEKEEWEKTWIGIKSGSDTTGKMMKVTLPTTARAQDFENKSRSFKSRQHEDANECVTSSSNHGLFQESNSITSNNIFQVPFLWELSKYFIMKKVIDALYAKSSISMSSDGSKIISTEDRPKDASGSGTIFIVEAVKEAAKEAITDYFSNMTLGSSHTNENQDDRSSGDGNDGGDDGHRQGKSPIDLLKDKKYTTKVNVILLSGGDFFDKDSSKPLSTRLPESSPSHRRLENVKITPFLTVDFCKMMMCKELEREIRITVGSVTFGLHRTCDGFEPCGYFGWFHDELYVSFAPSAKDTDNVYLKDDYKAKDYQPGKTINKASHSKETATSIQKSVQVKGVLGNSQVGRVEVGGDLRKGTGGLDQQSNEHSLESPCMQTEGGFYILPKPIMHLAWLEYQYNPPSQIVVAAKIEDPNYRHMLNISPLCLIQKTKFSGTWVPEGNVEVAEYGFQAVQKLREIQQTEEAVSECSSSTSMSFNPQTWIQRRKSEKRKIEVKTWEALPVIQKYEKKLYINHAMTHLIHKENYRLSAKPTSQRPLWSGDDPLVRL